MKYGLQDREWFRIGRFLASCPKVEKVFLFGSRAKGSYRPDSDVDIVVYAPGISAEEMELLRRNLGNLGLPYSFDLAFFHELDRDDLKEKVWHSAVVVYDRESGFFLV